MSKPVAAIAPPAAVSPVQVVPDTQATTATLDAARGAFTNGGSNHPVATSSAPAPAAPQGTSGTQTQSQSTAATPIFGKLMGHAAVVDSDGPPVQIVPQATSQADAPKPASSTATAIAAAPAVAAPAHAAEPKSVAAAPPVATEAYAKTTSSTPAISKSAADVVMVGFHSDTCKDCDTIAPVVANDVLPAFKAAGGTFHKLDLSSLATRRTAEATAKSLHMGKAWDNNNNRTGFVMVFNKSHPEDAIKLEGSTNPAEYQALVTKVAGHLVA